MTGSTGTRADYGIDAPPVILGLVLAGIVSLVIGVWAYTHDAGGYWAFGGALASFLSAGLMVWTSRVGKIREGNKLVDRLNLQGDEQVLDVGCGRGLLLLAAARRLTTGKAVGLDLWQGKDQSGNRPEATLSNADIEQVRDRIVLTTGDMRALPFAGAAFDVVTAGLAIHNIPERSDRDRAVEEIARVLKPGGRIALLDFRATEEYVETLTRLGWLGAEQSKILPWMFPPMRIVTGRKPE